MDAVALSRRTDLRNRRIPQNYCRFPVIIHRVYIASASIIYDTAIRAIIDRLQENLAKVAKTAV